MPRPRKPTALKLLHGDFDKNPQRRTPDEPRGEAVALECPAWITGDARKEWKRVVAELFAVKICTAQDRAALEQYVTAYSQWREALRLVKREGGWVADQHGNTVEHPAAIASRRYADLIHKLLCQMGMTPASRTRLHVQQETSKPPMRRKRG